MKQLTDEVFAQVRLACEYAALDRPTLCGPALAALDTAQPVQVNAMLVEALKDTLYSLQVPPVSCQQGVVSKCKCRKCSVGCGDAALAAAQQAQPERAPSVPALTDAELAAFLRFDETTADDQSYDIEKPMMHRLAEIGLVFRKFGAFYQTTEYGMTVLAAAHGIKQGGQQ